jgi:very-short-patch-repair endonuclease
MSWSTLAQAQDGVITRDQLADHGLAMTTIDGMLKRDQLVSVAFGVYLVRGAPLTYRARLWTGVLSTGGVLGFVTAARLWGVIEGDRSVIDDQVHIVLPHSRRLCPPDWVRLHRVPVGRGEITAVSELPITSKRWTLCDYLPTVSDAQATKVADRALQRHWLTRDDIALRLRDFPRRRGNGRLRMLMDITSDGAAAKSERHLHALLRRGGLRGWLPNYPVWAAGELIGVVDLAFPDHRLAIEVDGMAYHVDTDRFQHDRTRGNDLVLLGWTVLHFTWADLIHRPNMVLRVIRAQLAGSVDGSISR